ncbi:putative PTS system trascriptional regulator, MltR-type [Clostridium neonatale]|uniref:BglG family transcription antiterminator n=1 Tax=Clostridium neonatale TaxID=137838 RepID=UPI00291BDA6A|nr:PTS sugar transporter subunit IIA [Clostridium neonatale]CAI3664942.1 putative PTS system trascriptional regulator, MltR-type [Clostridium neonatale]
MLNDRQNRLINILKEREEWITGKKLSNILKVTDRTIRSDIEFINEQASIQLIKSNIRKGYRIINQDVYFYLYKKEEVKIPQTSISRCIYIIRKLLIERKEVNLVSLQSKIYVSEHSIKRDLCRIRKMLEQYSGLKLIHRFGYIYLQGDEINKRKLCKDLIISKVQKNLLNLNQLSVFFKLFNLIEIKDILICTCEKYNYSIHEEMIPSLILQIGINIQRMIQGNYINSNILQDKLNRRIEYEISSTFYKSISKKINIKVKDIEIEALALMISNKGLSNCGANELVSIKEKFINTMDIVTEVLEEVYEVFNIDIRWDNYLINSLKMQLHRIIERKNNNVELENQNISNIRFENPHIFEVGLYIVEFWAKKLSIYIPYSEAEIISLYIGVSSGWAKNRVKYRAVAIVPYNQMFSKVYVEKILHIFKNYIDIVEILHYFEENSIYQIKLDLILTTTPFIHNLPIEMVVIKLFSDLDVNMSICKILNKLEINNFRVEFNLNIRKRIYKEYYYESIELSTPDEIIEYMCDKLYVDNKVNSKFKELVLNREKICATSITNTFAIPHTLGFLGEETIISVAQLKRPIKWGGFYIKFVILVVINKFEKQLIKILFDWISYLINNPNKMELLCESCSYDEFINKVKV